MSREGLHLDSLVELVLGVNFVIGVEDGEFLSIVGVEFYPRVVDCVLKSNSVVICRSPEGVAETELYDVGIHKQIGLNQPVLFFIVFLDFLPILLVLIEDNADWELTASCAEYVL